MTLKKYKPNRDLPLYGLRFLVTREDKNESSISNSKGSIQSFTHIIYPSKGIVSSAFLCLSRNTLNGRDKSSMAPIHP